MTKVTQYAKAPIERSLVLNTYSGGAGCACGCHGTYARPQESRKSAVVTRRLREVNAAIAKGEPVVREEIGLFPDGNLSICYEFVRPNGSLVRIYTQEK